MPKVSVIIPVYNTERYLDRCLASVCSQTLTGLEIICINDYSTDGSLKILEKYAAYDKRIKIINFKGNKGASEARNEGIRAAEGEYLGFIDSDDYIDADFYEKLYLQAASGGADIVKGSDIKLCHPDGSIEIDEQNSKIKQNKINFGSQYTTCIYKTCFIKNNNITFPRGLLVGEDPVFTVKAALLSNKIDIIDDSQYYYMRRFNSLNSEFWDREKILSYKKYIEEVTDFALAQNLTRDEHQILFGRILNDIDQTKSVKNVYDESYNDIFEQLYRKVLSKTFVLPLRLLFDASVLISARNNLRERRGLYMVAYNILKQFKKDPRFDITLWVEKGNYDRKGFKDDEMLKDLKSTFSLFSTGKDFNYRIIKNPKFNFQDYDIFFSPYAITEAQPVSKRPAVFNMLHDVIPLLKNNWIEEEHRYKFWKTYGRLTSDVNCFCVSQNCKEGFLRFFDRLDEKKMTVVYNAPSQEFRPEKDKEKLQKVLDKYHIPSEHRGKYVFYFGSVNDPRKNIIFNIKCFIEFIKKYEIKDLFLYLGGSSSSNLDRVLRTYLNTDYEKYGKYIVTPGYIDDKDVNTLYSGALFFSFLSLYEGFGMPPLEAMMCGVPVVCADNSSLPEVAGDAAIMVNAKNTEQIIEAFGKFYFDEDLRNKYIKKGLERAGLFSWEKTYKIISERIMEVASGK